MKPLLFTIYFLISLHLFGQWEGKAVLKYSITYQGKNIYVQNPFRMDNYKTFCTVEVRINGEVVLDTIETSAYEIDLSKYPINAKLEVEIIHYKDCLPKILNGSFGCFPLHKFRFEKLSIENDTLFFNAIKAEAGSKFLLEHFLFDRWTNAGELVCTKSDSLQNFCFPISLHSLKNQFRVKYLEKSGRVFYSPVLEYSKDKLPVTFEFKGLSVLFGDSVYYKVKGKDGEVVSEGISLAVSFEALPKGSYYLLVDNTLYRIKRGESECVLMKRLSFSAY